MTGQHTRQLPGQKGRFRPRVEALEDRCLPAANFAVIGSAMLIWAPTTRSTPSENITIIDNGGSGINNVVAFSTAVFIPNVAISDVFVVTGRTNAHVSYNLAGDLFSSRSVTVLFGPGRNSFAGTIRRDLHAGTKLAINVNGGKDTDNISLTQIGSLLAGSNLSFNASGGGGSNTLTYQTTSFVSVGTGASLGINFTTFGRSDNHYNVTFNGQLNGNSSFNGIFGNGNNTATIDYEVVSGSTGTIMPGSLQGGAARDDFTYIVHNAGTGFTNNQKADGGGGFNTIRRTPAVIATNFQVDQIFP